MKYRQKNRFKIQRNKLALLLAILIFDPVRCTVPHAAALAAQFPPAIVITEGKTEQGFAYLSGGVGADERLALEERAKAFNVKLVFADTDGSYVADVKLEIAGVKNDAILSTTTSGPWFYIQLPPGIYNLKASLAGQSKEAKAFRVSKGKSAQQVFVWAVGKSHNAAPAPQG